MRKLLNMIVLQNEDISISVELRPCDDGQTGSCLKSVTLLRNSVSIYLPKVQPQQHQVNDFTK